MADYSEPMEIKDGIYPGMSRTDYGRIPAINHSTLKNFRRTPAHVLEAIKYPPEPTESLEFGTAFHCAVLEPDKFAATYVVAPKVDGRTKAGKAAKEAFAEESIGKVVIDEVEAAIIAGMQRGLRSNPVTDDILSSPGKTEVCLVWTDEESGVRCKALIDKIISFGGGTSIIDLKSCLSASRSAFSRDIDKYQYDEQAAFYLGGANALAPSNRRWLWIACEKKRPYLQAVYEPDNDMLLYARDKIRQHLIDYKECMKTGIWPGYPNEIVTLSPSRWAKTSEEEGES